MQEETSKAPDSRNPKTVALSFASFYGFVLFFCILCLSGGDSGAGVVFSLPLFAVISATIFCAAAWSVLGTGSLSERLRKSSYYGLITALCAALAGSIVAAMNSVTDFQEVATGFVLGCLGLIVASVSSQLAFWVLRGFFGWQFIWKDGAIELSYRLSDIFIVTALVAFCVAAPQIAALQSGFVVHESNRVVQVPVTNPDGTTTYKEVQQSQQQFLKKRMYGSFGAFSLLAFICTLLSVPFMTLVFRPQRDGRNGCGLAACYVGCFSIVSLMIIFIATGGAGFVAEPIIYLIALLGAYAAALGVPLATAFEMGLRLTSPRREVKSASSRTE